MSAVIVWLQRARRVGQARNARRGRRTWRNVAPSRKQHADRHDLDPWWHVRHGLGCALPRGSAHSPSDCRRVLDGPDAGYEPAVPRVRGGHELRHVCRGCASTPKTTPARCRICSRRVPSSFGRQRAQSISATGASGGNSASAPIGAIPTVAAPGSKGSTIIPSCMSRTAMPKPTPSGPPRSCPPKPSGSLRRAAD